MGRRAKFLVRGNSNGAHSLMQTQAYARRPRALIHPYALFKVVKRLIHGFVPLALSLPKPARPEIYDYSAQRYNVLNVNVLSYRKVRKRPNTG